MAIAAVARYTLLELTRRRFVVVFAVLGLAIAGFLEWIASALMNQPVSGEDRTAAILLVLADIGPAGHSTAGAVSPSNVMGIFAFAIAMVVVNHDLDSGAVVSILSKPLTRAGYAIGKVLAAAILLVGATAFVCTSITVLIAFNGQNEMGVVVAFFITTAANLMLLMLIVMTLTVYMSNIVAGVIAFIIAQVIGLLEPLQVAVSDGDITNPFWSRLIQALYSIDPLRLTSGLDHEAVAVTYRVGLYRPDGDPFAGLPPVSGLRDVAVWLIYLLALFGLFVLALKRKQI